MKRSLILAFLVSAFVLAESQAAAQLLMSRSRVEKTVAPGATVVDSITLHNRSDKPMPITIYWEDFEYIEPFDGKKKFLSGESSQYSMAGWISFSPREATIQPGSSVTINYTIKVPNSASGGRYGVMFFESGKRGRTEGTGVNIITRVGSLFFIELTNKDKASAIKDMALEKGQIQGVFENSGNIVLFPRGIYYIMNAEGLVVERGEVEKIYLPPANTADFAVALPESLVAGKYNFVLTFDLGDGFSVVKEVDFSKASDGTFELLQVRD